MSVFIDESISLCNHYLGQDTEHFQPPRKFSCACLQSLSPHPRSRQPLAWFLSLQISFACSGTAHINVIKQCVLCVWLLSLCMFWDSSMSLCVSLVHSFWLLCGIPQYGGTTVCLFIHLLVDVWVVSTIWLLWIIPLCTSLYLTFCGHCLYFSWVFTWE